MNTKLYDEHGNHKLHNSKVLSGLPGLIFRRPLGELPVSFPISKVKGQ